MSDREDWYVSTTMSDRYPHFVSLRVSDGLVLASRVYMVLSILVFLYMCVCMRMLERCALVATLLQVYRTFPDRVSAMSHVVAVSFRAAFWITMIDYLGEENCKSYYESDVVELLRLRLCNCLRSGLYCTQGDEAFACTDRYRVGSIRPSQAPALRFHETHPPAASRELGPLRDYINALRASAGAGVQIQYDEESSFAEPCQKVFKEITKLMRFEEGYAELLAPRKREILAPVRVWDKGVILPGAWIMCTRDYVMVFQDMDHGNVSLCEVVSLKSGKKMYRSIFPSTLVDLERIMLPGLLPVVRFENFGLVSSGWFFWGMNILHACSFDELFQYLLSGREVFLTRLSSGGQSTLVLG